MSVVPEAQLLFTSHQTDREPGGWRVKEAKGPNHLIELLRANVRPTLRSVHHFPPFPTDGDREALPRRLEHRILPGGHRALWHTIQAGNDASGRPGNIACTGVALTRSDSAGCHGTEFWRSTSWPQPIGPIEVAAAGLPGRLEPGPLAAGGQALEFMFPPFDPAAPYPRRGLLLVLLDAVSTAVGGGRGVTLVVNDADEAAAWIATVCAWTAPSWTWRFTWSTFERAEDLAHPQVRPLHLVAIPRADLEIAQTAAPQRLLIDTSADRVRFEEGFGSVAAADPDAWTLSNGMKTPVTPWSRHLMGFAQDVEGLARELQRIRAASATVTTTSAFPVAAVQASADAEPPMQQLRAFVDAIDQKSPRDPLPDIHWDAMDPSADEPTQYLEGKLAEITRLIRSAPRKSETTMVALRLLDLAAHCGLTPRASDARSLISEVLRTDEGPEVVREYGTIRSSEVKAALRGGATPDVPAIVAAWLDYYPPSAPVSEVAVLTTGSPAQVESEPAASPNREPGRKSFTWRLPGGGNGNWQDQAADLAKKAVRSSGRSGADPVVSEDSRALLRSLGIDWRGRALASPVVSDKDEDRRLLAKLIILATMPVIGQLIFAPDGPDMDALSGVAEAAELLAVSDRKFAAAFAVEILLALALLDKGGAKYEVNVKGFSEMAVGRSAEIEPLLHECGLTGPRVRGPAVQALRKLAADSSMARWKGAAR